MLYPGKVYFKNEYQKKKNVFEKQEPSVFYW